MSNVEKLIAKVKNRLNSDKIDERIQSNNLVSSPSSLSSFVTQTEQHLQSCSQLSARHNIEVEGPTIARLAAAEAAQQRLQNQLSTPQTATRTLDSIRRQAKRELEQEQEQKDKHKKAFDLKEHYFGKRQINVESAPVVDYSKLAFKCPDLFGDDVCAPYDELEQRIQTTLKSQYNSEPTLAATHLFLTLNQRDQEKLNDGKEMICKYFENLISNVNEDKYRRIRLKNKIYLEKVSPLKYAKELLEASGFVSSHDNELLVYQEHSIEQLKLAHDALMNSKAIQIQLDTNLRIFQSIPGKSSVPPVQLLPQDPLFYQVTMNELLLEKQRQKELLEKEEMLRTKAMRERDEKSCLNVQYKYTILLIRMPDEIILQVIFPSNNCISSLFDYLRSYCLVHNSLPFILTSNADRRRYLSQDEHSMIFSQCNLVPTALFSFRWNDQALHEVKEQTSDFITNIYIKPELLASASRP